MKKNNIYNPKSIKNILPTPNVILPEALTNELNLIPKKEYTPVIKPIIKSLHNIPDEYLKFSQMPTTINGVSVVLSNQDQLPILRPDGNGGFINYLATYIAPQSGGVQTVSGDGSTIAVNNTDPNNPIVSLLPAWVTANTNAITSAQNKANQAETDAQTGITNAATANTAIETINNNGIVQSITTPDGNVNTNAGMNFGSKGKTVIITSDKKGNINFESVGGGEAPTTTLTPTTISAGESIAAIFPLNPNQIAQNQNYGRWSTVLGTLGTGATPDTYVTLGYDILGVYDSKNVEGVINLNFDQAYFSSNFIGDVVGAIAFADPKVYITVISGVTYGIVTFQVTSAAGYQMLSMFDSQLLDSTGTLAQTWVGQLLSAFNAGTTPIPLPSNNQFTSLNEVVNDLGVTLQYSKNSFPVDYIFQDSNGTSALSLPPVVGSLFLSGNVRYLNNQYISFRSPKAVLVNPTGLLSSWSNLAISGVNTADVVSDMTFSNGTYYACTLGGYILSSTNLTTWTTIYQLSGANFSGFNSIDTDGINVLAVTQNGQIYQAKISTPTSWSILNTGISKIGQLFQIRYYANGTCVTQAGNQTGTWAACGVTNNSNAIVVYCHVITQWYSQYIVLNFGTLSSMTFDGTNWIFGGSQGGLAYIGSPGLNITQGMFSCSFGGVSPTTVCNSICNDGKNIYATSTSGYIFVGQAGSKFGANIYPSALPTPMVNPIALASNGTTTVLIGTDNSNNSVTGYNAVNTAVSFTAAIVNAFQSRPSLPFVQGDNRLVVFSDLNPTPITNLPTALNFATTGMYVGNITANTTYGISNISPGEAVQVVMTSTGAFTPTFTGVIFAGGFRPGAMVNGQTDVYTFINTGSQILGAILQSFS